MPYAGGAGLGRPPERTGSWGKYVPGTQGSASRGCLQLGIAYEQGKIQGKTVILTSIGTVVLEIIP
jgi:hypothetical protein